MIDPTVFWRCKCGHLILSGKRKNRQCSNCGIRETKDYQFQKWTRESLRTMIEMFENEHGYFHKKGQKKGMDLNDIEPHTIALFCRNRADKIGLTHEENLEWIRGLGLEGNKAERTLEALYVFCRWKPKTSGPRTPGSPSPGPPPDPPHRPIVPKVKPNCWGVKYNSMDNHCKSKCETRKSCKKEMAFQEYQQSKTP